MNKITITIDEDWLDTLDEFLIVEQIAPLKIPNISRDKVSKIVDEIWMKELEMINV